MGGGFKGKSKGKGGFKGRGEGMDDFKGKGKGDSKGDTKGKGKDNGKGKSAGKGKSSGEAPVAQTLFDVLEVGTFLTALYADGEWYKAQVVQLRSKAPEVKVRFIGYEDMGDFWLGVHMLKSKLLQGFPGAGSGNSGGGAAAPPPTTGLPEAGSTCQVDVGLSKYMNATIEKIDKKKADAPIKVLVEFWVHPDQIWAVKPPAAEPKAKAAAKAKAALAPAAGAGPIPVGTQLTALAEDGNWYKATVAQTRKDKHAPILVHYGGCDESMDRWVRLDEIRSKLLKATEEWDEEPPARKGKGKGKGKSKANDENEREPKGKGKSKSDDNGKAKGKGKSDDEKGKAKGKGKSDDKGTGKGKDEGKGGGKGKGKDEPRGKGEGKGKSKGEGKGEGKDKGEGKGKSNSGKGKGK